MVRFYFEIRHGDGTVLPDFEGQTFAHLSDARAEAEASLRELIAADITSAAPLQPRSIAIHDEDGKMLAVVELVATLHKEDRRIGDT